MIETIKEIGDGMHAKIYLAHKKSLNQNCNDSTMSAPSYSRISYMNTTLNSNLHHQTIIVAMLPNAHFAPSTKISLFTYGAAS